MRDRIVRDHYSGTDLDEVEHYLRQTYAGVSLRLQDPRSYFRLSHEALVAPAFAINRLSTTQPVDADVAPLERYAVGDLRSGRVTRTSRYFGQSRSGSGDVYLLPPAGGFQTEIEPSDVDVVTLDVDRVADYATHVCGLADLPPRFPEMSPLSPALARHWRATVAHVRDEVLAAPVASAEPIILDSVFRLLASALLTVFPNSALESATDPHSPATSAGVDAATLREVVDYLDTHAGDPIGPAEIADVADAPYRAVAEGLRRRHGTHPAGLLWRARLRGARDELSDADPARATVAGIAARWGFARVDTFSLAYTAFIGESPERTLRG